MEGVGNVEGRESRDGGAEAGIKKREYEGER